MPLAQSVLAALTYLLLKHVIADYFLQTSYQYQNKGTYGHPGGLIHAAIHVLLTAPVFFIMAPKESWIVAAILIGEFAVHYHVDFAKERIVKSRQLHPGRLLYWQLFGADQFVHHLTYVAIVWVLLSL